MTPVATTLRSCYLAGPMRGIEDYNFPTFHEAAAWLRSENWEVFSPAERDEGDPVVQEAGVDKAGWGGTLDFAYFMSHDLKAVCEMDAVVCLPGWERSQGARLETMVAVEIGHPVFEIQEGPSVFGGIYLGRRRLLSVANERVAAEFIAGTRAYDALPVVTAWEFE